MFLVNQYVNRKTDNDRHKIMPRETDLVDIPGYACSFFQVFAICGEGTLICVVIDYLCEGKQGLGAERAKSRETRALVYKGTCLFHLLIPGCALSVPVSRYLPNKGLFKVSVVYLLIIITSYL